MTDFKLQETHRCYAEQDDGSNVMAWPVFQPALGPFYIKNWLSFPVIIVQVPPRLLTGSRSVNVWNTNLYNWKKYNYNKS